MITITTIAAEDILDSLCEGGPALQTRSMQDVKRLIYAAAREATLVILRAVDKGGDTTEAREAREDLYAAAQAAEVHLGDAAMVPLRDTALTELRDLTRDLFEATGDPLLTAYAPGYRGVRSTVDQDPVAAVENVARVLLGEDRPECDADDSYYQRLRAVAPAFWVEI